MRILNWFLGKKKSLLTQEDIVELNNLERQAYMEKAREIIKKRGEQKAKNELEPKSANSF